MPISILSNQPDTYHIAYTKSEYYQIFAYSSFIGIGLFLLFWISLNLPLLFCIFSGVLVSYGRTTHLISKLVKPRLNLLIESYNQSTQHKIKAKSAISYIISPLINDKNGYDFKLEGISYFSCMRFPVYVFLQIICDDNCLQILPTNGLLQKHNYNHKHNYNRKYKHKRNNPSLKSEML